MPYYLETDDRQLLKKLRLTNVCKDCGSRLECFYDIQKHLPYLQCKTNPDHNGIAREASRYQMGGLSELNINTRREIMEQEHGKEKTTALEKLPTTGILNKDQAMSILHLVYPKAPDDEIIRCAILCRDFGLHPLMKEVYLIPFKEKNGRDNYVTVLGINATRKLMARRGSYSYLDRTPRVMTEQEQKEIFGEVDSYNIKAITKLKTKDGLEAQGYGSWPKNKEPYGVDKGNNKANMAFIRSERNAFGRLYADAIPQGVEIIDEAYVDVPDVGKVIEATGEIVEGEVTQLEETKTPQWAPGDKPESKEHWCEEHNCAYEQKKGPGNTLFWSHKNGGKWCNEIKKKEPKEEAPPAEEPTPASAESPQKPARDPYTIKTINELFKACNDDFKNPDGEGMQPREVCKELGVGSQNDISDTPAECYLKVAAVR